VLGILVAQPKVTDEMETRRTVSPEWPVLLAAQIKAHDRAVAESARLAAELRAATATALRSVVAESNRQLDAMGESKTQAGHEFFP
jgi:hypothetical protein